MGFGAAIAWNTVRAKPIRHNSTPSSRRLPFESIRFRSSDGSELSGWLVKRRNSLGVVILCHGVDSTRYAMLDVAEMLHRHGFSSLLFDFRARGESGGSRCTIGFREVEDLLAAI
jgi:alpha-beta hydrolase superfamily lysophospholipase